MLQLYTGQITSLSPAFGDEFIARVSNNYSLPMVARAREVLLVDDRAEPMPVGFRAYFVLDKYAHKLVLPLPSTNVFKLPNDQFYLADGDVVRFNPGRLTLRTIYRKTSRSNSFLVTERCNNFCLMCSQPPKEIDDSYIVKQLLEAIPLIHRSTNEITLSGGEPTLLGADLITLIRTMKNYLPSTSLHMLSNGRSFSNFDFTRRVAEVGHHDFMVGIPLYSDISNLHDYVVQADGAFDDTILGILNLKRFRQKVEIRVVIHQQTYERLPQLAEFLARNLLFVDQVALMGLEMTGFTKHNLEDLWIDPVDYQQQLVEAVEILQRYRMKVSVYNHQLCLLDKRLWPVAVRSISDWKNEYMPECEPCSKKTECGGFFSSAKLRYSDHIKPFAVNAN